MIADAFLSCVGFAICRRQQALENTARVLSCLAAAQQQMLDLTGRLTECSRVIQAAKAHKLSSSDHDAL